MTVELRPLGVRCNILCQYCYQNPQRDAGLQSKEYDLDAMKAAITEAGGPFTLFGGEPLLLPESDLENLWAWGYRKYGSNGLQTNGTLINDRHIEMFRKYRVRVGISIDGPGTLNDVRWGGSLDSTREKTSRTEDVIASLCRDGFAPNLIVTLHRHNATGERIPAMKAWFRRLDRMGVSRVRLHLLEADHADIEKRLALSSKENIHALLRFARLERVLEHLRFDLFEDMRRMLRGDDQGAGCVWHACDPYTTSAVQGVEGMGQRSNCGRTNKDGIDFVKSDTPGFERQLALYQTPQEYRGCKDCRFFLMCKGNCPGTAASGDWRNRSEHCAVWMALYEHFEEESVARGARPLSRRSIRNEVERAMLEAWSAGYERSIADILRELGPADARSSTRSPNGSTVALSTD